MIDVLCVGIVQTTLDRRIAWSNGPSMLDRFEEAKAESEIERAIHALGGDSVCPHIVLLPELAAPRHMQKKLQSHADRLNSIVIAGLNYRVLRLGRGRAVANEARLFLPKRWLGRKTKAPRAGRNVGKTYAAWGETDLLENAGFVFQADPVAWLFDAGEAGRFAVAICYDFLDLERLAMYRGQIHHFFVLAYNQDTQSFNHAAEALARMAFCNVVVCNTGYYGGSLAVSPYRQPYRRTLYRSEGANLFSAQTVRLPVASLDWHQRAARYGSDAEFKARPPGFERPQDLTLTEDALF